MTNNSKDGVNVWKIEFFEGHYSYLAGDSVLDVVQKIPNQDWDEDYNYVTEVKLVGANSISGPFFGKLGKKPVKNL